MKKPPSLARKRLAYRRAFCGDRKVPHLDGQIILEDWQKFCQVRKGGLVVSPKQQMTDPYATMYRAALRDCYQRLTLMLGLGEADEFDTSEETPDESART